MYVDVDVVRRRAFAVAGLARVDSGLGPPQSRTDGQYPGLLAEPCTERQLGRAAVPTVRDGGRVTAGSHVERQRRILFRHCHDRHRRRKIRLVCTNKITQTIGLQQLAD